jgi:hypothetical protein
MPTGSCLNPGSGQRTRELMWVSASNNIAAVPVASAQANRLTTFSPFLEKRYKELKPPGAELRGWYCRPELNQDQRFRKPSGNLSTIFLLEKQFLFSSDDL